MTPLPCDRGHDHGRDEQQDSEGPVDARDGRVEMLGEDVLRSGGEEHDVEGEHAGADRGANRAGRVAGRASWCSAWSRVTRASMNGHA